jgi:coproporphyrinogen III oxidase
MTKTRENIIAFLQTLRNTIIQEIEAFEPTKRFEKKPWTHINGGGGEIGLLRGDVFEKAAVNWSGVSGSQFPMQDGSGPFFATGVSLIFHMHNPHAPTAHMNVRYIETENGYWFGGGFDLTPMGFPYSDDTKYFHEMTKKNLDQFSLDLYPAFSQNAKEYFYIPHRKKERGIGGIFFDHYRTDDFSQDLLLWQSIGNQFLECILPIYKKRVLQEYTAQEKQKQLEQRAHYVEFNLLYDRGTKFGFLSQGNPEAILCSMPPQASW